MTATKPEPTLDWRAAALAIERESLLKVNADRARLKAAQQAATTTHRRAHGALAAIMSDPMTFATTAPDVLTARKEALVASAQTAMDTTAALTAHEQEHNLAGRGAQLHQDEQALEQERITAADREDAALMVDLGSKLAAVQARMEQRRYRPGAKLLDLGFPEGVLSPPDPRAHLSGDAQMPARSVLVDHVLFGISLAYPDIAMPPEAEARLAGLASPTAAGGKRTRFYVSRIGWDIYPRRYS